jgi:small subunit ribosomal protein S4
MARNVEPACRKCRREGMKLFLKGARCESAKCPIEKQDRNKPPGMHSWRRGRHSDYGVRLREKQKVKRFYGVEERQFRGYFHAAEKLHANTGETLLSLLERRLDNVVYKLHFASSRKCARMLVSQGHIHVNGRKVDIPSYLVRQGDVITVKAADKTTKMIKGFLETYANAPVQDWLRVEPAAMRGEVAALPKREHVSILVNEQLVVEFCSR